MSYSAIIPVLFPCPRPKVYKALCDLGTHPLWCGGMVSISHSEPMTEGLVYEAENILAGHRNLAKIAVVRLVPNEVIQLENNSGSVTYQATFRLRDTPSRGTEVSCELRFAFRNFVLDLARPAIEGIAEAKTRGDLEALRAILCEDNNEA